jgi:phage shock protein C
MNGNARPEANPRRLYRDTEHGMLAGVCAGIADYFGFSVRGFRLLTVLSCFVALPAIIVGYLVASFLLPRKPTDLYHNEGEETFWRSVRRDPHFTMDDIRMRYRDLDGRLQGIEQYVTSPRFDLDQKFRDLE